MPSKSTMQRERCTYCGWGVEVDRRTHREGRFIPHYRVVGGAVKTCEGSGRLPYRGKL